MQRRKVLAITCVLSTVSLAPLTAQIFGGLPVYDAANHVEAISQTIKLVSQLQQMVATYEKVKSHYDEAIRQATYIRSMGTRYRSPTNIWRGITISDTSGKTGTWVTSVNNGVAASEAWSRATYRLPGGFGTVPASHRERAALEYASLELADGTAVGAIDTIGRVRVSGPQVERAMSMLEADSLSDDPALHTQAAQMDKANAVAIIRAKQAADANKLSVALTEMSLLRMRLEREASARALDIEMARRTAGATVVSDLSGEMRSFRMP